MDKSSFAGLFVALGGILLGLILEGGKLGQVVQPTAALIVFGGTLGAVMLQFPLRVIVAAFRRLGQVFFTRSASDNHWNFFVFRPARSCRILLDHDAAFTARPTALPVAR